MRGTRTIVVRDRSTGIRRAATVLVAIVVCIVLYGAPSAASLAPRRGLQRIALAAKDADFRVIPPWRGGASGAVWYGTTGPPLDIQLRAAGLVPRMRYRLDLAVSDAVYAVAGVEADARGTIAFDTTLDRLADGVCVSRAHPPPRSLRGTLSIKFWLERDGSPRSGTSPGVDAPSSLPCHGNGDGVFSYTLLEEATAVYHGGPIVGGSAGR